MKEAEAGLNQVCESNQMSIRGCLLMPKGSRQLTLFEKPLQFGKAGLNQPIRK